MPRLIHTAAPRPVAVRLNPALLTALRRACGGDIGDDGHPSDTPRQRLLWRNQANKFAVEMAANAFIARANGGT
jgi:hypothetical protein